MPQSKKSNGKYIDIDNDVLEKYLIVRHHLNTVRGKNCKSFDDVFGELLEYFKDGHGMNKSKLR